MTGRDRDERREKGEKDEDQEQEQGEEEVPLHREPRDEEPFWQRRSDEVPDADHVITKQPARARRKVEGHPTGD